MLNLPAFTKDSWLHGIQALLSGPVQDASFIVCQYCKTVRTLYPLYEHQWVDIRAGPQWFEAQIRTVGDGWARIHFKGYKAYQDEVLHIPSERLAVMHAYTDSPLFEEEENDEGEEGSQNVKRPRANLWEEHELWASPKWLSLEFVRHKIDVLDSLDQWIVAYITENMVARDGRMVLVHYEGWGRGWDEWMNEESYRIVRRQARHGY